MRDVQAFLASAGWSDAHRIALAGDMSPRRYFRLNGPRGSAILMDADTPQTAFRDMTEFLRGLGLSAPEILADGASQGLLLLEDLGDLSITKLLEQDPNAAASLYEDAVALLLDLRGADAPALARPDADDLVAWTAVADHYPGAGDLAPFRGVLRDLLDNALNSGSTLSLRDLHADNLMWLSDRDGIRRFGLLDYQDAFLTHPCYDLVSLLTDARTLVASDLREATLSAYLERSGDDPEPFRQAFAAYSAQRNVRILGLFAKSNRHLSALARVHGYVCEALEHPAFDTVRTATLAALPEPAA